VAAPPAVRGPEDLAHIAGPADVIELRIDLLRPAAPQGLPGVLDLTAWIAAAPCPVLATVRSVAEGGAFDEGPQQAARLLEAAAAAGAAWLDVEHDVWPHLGETGSHVRLLASHHGADAPAASPSARATWSKRARPVSDAQAWADLCAPGGPSDGSFLVPYGALGCTRGAFVGPAQAGFLFGSATEEAAVVPGQPTLTALLDELRAGEVTPQAALFGLVGSPPAWSPSPAMHNAVFRGLGCDALYVPLPGLSLAEAMALPVRGLSVTHPHKRAAFAAVDSLTDLAASVRAAVKEHFVVEGPLGLQWAYSVNGRGGVERYMDANDLPAALAPLWGFCKPTDKAWSTTMRFAFDPENAGYVSGPLGGLGSRHTPGTWPLGDIMRWVAFGLMEDQETSETALERLTEVAFDGGMLAEAYDPEGSGASVRHWFAFPGAALGALLLDHAARDAGE